MTVWAVVLNWNAWEMTMRCVRALLTRTKADIILVVDNGSVDEDFWALQRAVLSEERVHLSRTSSNLGYAGGMQWGIREALASGANLVWLVNNDCTVLEGSLEPLVREMEDHPETGACSGIVVHPDVPEPGRYNAGARCDLVTGRVVPTSAPARAGLPRYPVGFVAGSAWLLRAAAIRVVGGLDCRLFLLGEEADWCFRARRAGFQSVVVPSSRAEAAVSATLARFPCETLYYSFRNMAWLARRHGTLTQTVPHACVLLFYRLPKKVASLLLRDQRRCVPLAVRGAWDGVARSAAWSDDPAAALGSRLPSLT
jgi:GT2 family glycosyltransferase